jgi:hypothetical protein
MLDVAAGCKNKAHEALPEIDGCQRGAWAVEAGKQPAPTRPPDARMIHIVDAAFSTVISGAIFALLGVYFAGAGTWLAVLGGTWYYAIAGAGLIATGVLLSFLGRRLRLRSTASSDSTLSPGRRGTVITPSLSPSSSLGRPDRRVTIASGCQPRVVWQSFEWRFLHSPVDARGYDFRSPSHDAP